MEFYPVISYCSGFGFQESYHGIKELGFPGCSGSDDCSFGIGFNFECDILEDVFF
jgi:hypothetical protein